MENDLVINKETTQTSGQEFRLGFCCYVVRTIRTVRSAFVSKDLSEFEAIEGVRCVLPAAAVSPSRTPRTSRSFDSKLSRICDSRKHTKARTSEKRSKCLCLVPNFIFRACKNGNGIQLLHRCEGSVQDKKRTGSTTTNFTFFSTSFFAAKLSEI